MPLHMKLDQRTPMPDPHFKRGELLISNNGTLLLVLADQTAEGSDFRGAVIYPGQRDQLRGHTSDAWIAHNFTRLNGTVTLEQLP